MIRDLTSAKDDRERVARCGELMKKRPDDHFYQAAILRKIVAIRGAEAFDDLLAALSEPDETFRAEVVRLAAELPGERGTVTWIDQLATARGNRLAGLIDVLARIKDSKALSAVSKYLEHKDEGVRRAALRASRALGGR